MKAKIPTYTERMRNLWADDVAKNRTTAGFNTWLAEEYRQQARTLVLKGCDLDKCMQTSNEQDQTLHALIEHVSKITSGKRSAFFAGIVYALENIA